jgi:hypothetical protein
MPMAFLYINKNLCLQIFKLLFFKHYASFAKLGAYSILFLSSISTFCRPPSVVRLLEIIISLKEKREGEKNYSRRKVFGKEEDNSYKYEGMIAITHKVQ